MIFHCSNGSKSNEMDFQDIIHSIFFAASIQGLMMAAVFYRKSKQDRAYGYLSSIFLIFSIVLLYWIGFWTGVYQAFYLSFTSLIDPLDLSLGPLIFLFIKSLLDREFKFKNKHWIHFLPLLIFWVLAGLKFAHINMEDGLFNISNLGVRTYTLFYTISKNLQFFGYLLWLVILVTKKSNKWLFRLAFPFVVYFTGRIMYTISVFSSLNSPSWDYTLSFIISSAVFVLAYLNHLSPVHLRGKKIYAKSSLSEDHEPHICRKVLDHIHSNKRYLDHEYSINDLSNEVSISRHHISQALNRHLGKSFNKLINELRIKESIQLLRNPEKFDDKIMSVAFQAGFNNKVSFNQYFKKTTGISPSEYRKNFIKAN